MVYTVVLETTAERIESSSLSSRTSIAPVVERVYTTNLKFVGLGHASSNLARSTSY